MTAVALRHSQADVDLRFSTAVEITSDTNDYALPASIGGRFVLRVSTDATRTLTGIAATAATDSVIIVNIGSNDLVLAHQNVGSAAANRLLMSTGSDITLAPDEAMYLWHDDVTGRWRNLSMKG